MLRQRGKMKQNKTKQKITDVENWRSFSNSKQLVHGRIIRLGAGIFPINSNRNLYIAIRASQYNAMYMYICVYILAICWRVPVGKTLAQAGSGRLVSLRSEPAAPASLRSGHSPRVSRVFSSGNTGDVSVQQHTILYFLHFKVGMFM